MGLRLDKKRDLVGLRCAALFFQLLVPISGSSRARASNFDSSQRGVAKEPIENPETQPEERLYNLICQRFPATAHNHFSCWKVVLLPSAHLSLFTFPPGTHPSFFTNFILDPHPNTIHTRLITCWHSLEDSRLSHPYSRVLISPSTSLSENSHRELPTVRCRH